MRPLAVIVVTPPIQKSGGIGRMVSYEADQWASDPRFDVRIVDSRGSGGPVSSLLHCARAVFQILAAKLRGECDGLHINLSTKMSTFRKGAVMSVAKWSGIPYVVHLHGSGYDSFFSRLPKVAQHLVASRIQGAKRVLVLGTHWASFCERSLGIARTKLTIVPNAVPPAQRNLGRRDSDPRALRVLFAGRLGERKGSDRVVLAVAAAAKRGTRVEVDFAGDGDAASVKALADEHGVGGQVRMHGWLSTKSVGELMGACDALVLPSRAENQPLSVLEAMASGIPAIAADVGAVAELIDHNVSGILIEPDDIEALTTGLITLSDSNVRASMGEAAARKWSSNYTVEAHWDKMSTVWLSAFGDPS